MVQRRSDQNSGGEVLKAIDLAGILAVSVCSVGQAHDHNHPEQEEWFRSLHAKGGAWCCTGDDAEIVDWELMGDHYRVHLGDQWVTVPEDAIVEGANKVGGARVWTYFADGHQHVRCFLPDSLT
jgi:hypothetical protein